MEMLSGVRGPFATSSTTVSVVFVRGLRSSKKEPELMQDLFFMKMRGCQFLEASTRISQTQNDEIYT